MTRINNNRCVLFRAIACLILTCRSLVAFQAKIVLFHRKASHPRPVFLFRQSAKQEGELNKAHAAEPSIMERRSFASTVVIGAVSAFITLQVNPKMVEAAPPFAVIAEELGYFPVTNSKGETIYVPKRIQRASSEQAIQLAQKLRDSGAVLYTAYWCPHCARQKELLGREAWQLLRNVECASRGYQSQPAVCLAKQIDGYPTWILGNGKRISGERPLSELAKAVGFTEFDESLEQSTPPLSGSSACK